MMHLQEPYDHPIAYNGSAKIPTTRRSWECLLLWEFGMTTTMNEWHDIWFWLCPLFLRPYSPSIDVCTKTAKIPWYNIMQTLRPMKKASALATHHWWTWLTFIIYLPHRNLIGLRIVRHETLRNLCSAFHSQPRHYSNFFKREYELRHLQLACNRQWSVPYNICYRTYDTLMWFRPLEVWHSQKLSISTLYLLQLAYV